VPSSLVDKEHLELHWDANNEGLIWNEHGEPLQGLTGGGERVEWVLPKEYRDGKEHVFYVEMACNGMFGNATSDSIQPPDPNRYFRLHTADIVAVNLEARQLRVDFWIIGGMNSSLTSCGTLLTVMARCRARVPRGLLGGARGTSGVQRDHRCVHRW